MKFSLSIFSCKRKLTRKFRGSLNKTKMPRSKKISLRISNRFFPPLFLVSSKSTGPSLTISFSRKGFSRKPSKNLLIQNKMIVLGCNNSSWKYRIISRPMKECFRVLFSKLFTTLKNFSIKKATL